MAQNRCSELSQPFSLLRGCRNYPCSQDNWWGSKSFLENKLSPGEGIRSIPVPWTHWCCFQRGDEDSLEKLSTPVLPSTAGRFIFYPSELEFLAVAPRFPIAISFPSCASGTGIFGIFFPIFLFPFSV